MQKRRSASPKQKPPRVLQEANITRIRFQLPQAFSPAAPIDRRELFAGRLAQIDQIIGAVAQQGQHAILFGERGVGKTSLASTVHQFWNDEVKADDILVAPRVNCDTTDTFGTIWRKVLEEIQIIYDKRGWPFPRNGGILESAVHAIAMEEATPGDVRRFLELAQKWFIITIDEFDRLTDENSIGLFADTIKMLSDHAVDVTLILVGVADTVDELIADHASIDRALVQVLMPRMSIDELKEIVVKGLTAVGMTAAADTPEVIAKLSQGLPHYAHLLGLHAGLAAIGQKRTEVTGEDVSVALKVAVDSAQQSVRHAYHQATMSPRETLYPQVLVACAIAQVDDAGYFAPVDIRRPLTMVMKKRIEIPIFIRHLHALCSDEKGGVLQKIGLKGKQRFRFSDPLLKPYIVLRGLQDGSLDRRLLPGTAT